MQNGGHPKAQASPLSDLFFDPSHFAPPSEQTDDSVPNPDSLRPPHDVGNQRRHDLMAPPGRPTEKRPWWRGVIISSIIEESAQKPYPAIYLDLFQGASRRLYLALGGGPDREPGKSVPKKSGKWAFLAQIFPIANNIHKFLAG